MKSGIIINEQAILNDIASLKKIRDDITSLFSDICLETNKIPDFWIGEVGSLAFIKMNNYEEKFISYVSELDAKIAFLENSLQSYINADNIIKQNAEKNLSE